MKKLLKKMLASLLVTVMVLTAAPLNGFVGLKFDINLDWLNFDWLDFSTKSSAKETPSSGSCGENVTYTFNKSTGELVISGTGKMENYSWSSSPFYYNISIKSVVINNGVTSIGEYAFYNCTGLTSITIPNSITSIGYGAFEYCKGLTSITIPDSVTSIGNSAFYGCTGLTSITIPNSVTSIGGSTFCECTGLTSVTIGNSVTSISDWAFYNCTGLTSVTIPDSVTSIGSSAFKYCTSLTSITIGNSVEKIYPSSFMYCTSLKDIIIPNSVTSLGGSAFEYCTSLTSIVIGSGVINIGIIIYDEHSSSYGNDVFGHCNNLVNISVDKNNKMYDSRNNCNAIIETATNALVLGCKNTVIPNSITKIGGSAWGIHAFSGCTGLTNITIPDSVTSIGSGAFSGCTGLTSITVDKNNKIYDSRNNCNAIIETGTNTLIAGCKNTIIPDSVTSIGEYAFCNCTGLTNVTIGNSVTSIGEYAFCNCTGLTSVTIGNSVTSIGACAFVDTGYYDNSANWDDNGVLYIGNYLIDAKDTIKGEYKIKDGTKVIAGGVFVYRTGLTSVTIPDSVTSIGDRAFYDCTGLTSVTIPDSVTSIGEEAFEECTGLTSVTIGNSVTSIGEEAFEECTGLTSVTIPDSVTSIGDRAFYNCTSIKDVYYVGSEVDREKISVGSKNYDLLNATWHYNTYIPDEPGTPDEPDTPDIPHSKTYTVYTTNAGEIAFDNNLEYYLDHTSSTEYNSELAYLLMGMADAAYNEDCIKKSYASFGFNNSNGSKVFTDIYGENPDEEYLAAFAIGKKLLPDGTAVIMISVRGTGNDINLDFNGELPFLGEWLSNLDLGPDAIGIGTGWHHGFESAANYIWDKLKSEIYDGNDIPKLGTRFVITGHSRGAAVANLLAVKLFDYGVEQSKVYSYNFACPDVAKGSPLGWNWNGEHNNIFNICNCQDIISYVPGVALNASGLLGATTQWGKFGITKYFSFNWYDSNYTDLISPQIAHDQKTYLGYLSKFKPLSDFRDYTETVGSRIGNTLLKIFCPVDVVITDEFGKVLVSITNNTPTYYANNILVFVENDKKTVVLLDDINIYISITGTDNGTMEYAVIEKNSKTDTITDSITYSNVQIYKGKEMQSYYGENISASDVKLYVIDSNGVHVKKINPDGTETTLNSVKSVSICDDFSLNYKQLFKIIPKIEADDGVQYTVEYKSSNPKVVTIDNNGNVSGAKKWTKGTATITCTVIDEFGNKVLDTVNVTVGYAWWQWIIGILLLGFLWY